MRRVVWVFSVICVMSKLQAQHKAHFISQIEGIAKKLKEDKPAYQKCLKKEDSLFQIRELDIARGMHVIYKPDLVTIKAPLPYYYIRLKENTKRFYYYLKATALSGGY